MSLSEYLEYNRFALKLENTLTSVFPRLTWTVGRAPSEVYWTDELGYWGARFHPGKRLLQLPPSFEASQSHVRLGLYVIQAELKILSGWMPGYCRVRRVYSEELIKSFPSVESFVRAVGESFVMELAEALLAPQGMKERKDADNEG